MRTLVTGAQGFVGRYVCAALLRESSCTEVLGIGRSVEMPCSFSHRLSTRSEMQAPLPEDLALTLRDPRYRYEPMSIIDDVSLIKLMRELQPDYILHLASGLRGDLDTSLIETNVQGTATLLHAVAGAGLATMPRMVIGSSGGVYGRFPDAYLPLTESTPCEPADVYSSTKLAAEHISRVVGRTHGVPVVIARIFNIVGPGQSERHVAGRFARDLHTYKSTGTTFSVGQLNSTRDFIDVRDVAEAILLLAKRGKPDAIYNVASGTETHVKTVLDLLLTCSAISEASYNLAADEFSEVVPRHCADVSALNHLGFIPHVPLSQSLSELFEYYR